MSLFSIPFYPELLNSEVGGVKLTASYVLLIGAIIYYGEGRLNCCVASLETLAEDTGSTEKQVRDRRSELIRAGIVEVLEKDRSGYIRSVKINYDVLLPLFSKSGRKAFLKNRKGVPEKQETVTEAETGVGNTIINPNDNEEEKARMKPAVLYTRLKSIYHIRKDADKKNCIRAAEKLQEVFDDDTIIEAASRFYSVDRLKPNRFEDGTTWWPDFFWFLNPNKTDVVTQKIKKIPNLFGEGEPEKETGGYMEGIGW